MIISSSNLTVEAEILRALRPREEADAASRFVFHSALMLSARVQMPALSAVQPVEDEVGIPVPSAATAYGILTKLGLPAEVGRAPAGVTS
jgi:maleate cis-trans isomerase